MSNQPGAVHSGARDLIRTLSAEFPAVPQYALELSSVEYNLGLLSSREGQPKPAVASYQVAARLLESLKGWFPGMPAYRMKLAVTEVAIAEALAKTAWAEAEAALVKALQEQVALLAEYPGVAEYQRNAGRGHYQLGRLLLEHRPDDAIRHFEEARSLYEQLLRSRPDSDQDRSMLAENQILLTRALIEAHRLPDAVASAERIVSSLPADPKACLHAATLMIRCAGVAARAGDARLQEDCLTRAVGVLREAVRSRVIRSRAALDLPDLRALRDRDDFKQLRESVAESPRSG